MKKWLLILAALLGILTMGTESTAGMDVGKLQPVQVLCLRRMGRDVIVWTDTGDRGTGADLKAAVEDMKRSASAEIFLETADHLLLMPDCIDLLQDAAHFLRPSSTLCLLEGEPDMERIGQYLQVHAPQVTLMEYRAGLQKLQTLKTTDGRMALVS